MSDRLEYRVKCKEFSDAAVLADPTLRLVSGWYDCPLENGKQEHWWTVRQDGTIFDPTRKQFLSGGIPEFYQEFDGTFDCEQCGKSFPADDMIHEGRFHLCSDRCYLRMVGL